MWPNQPPRELGNCEMTVVIDGTEGCSEVERAYILPWGVACARSGAVMESVCQLPLTALCRGARRGNAQVPARAASMPGDDWTNPQTSYRVFSRWKMKKHREMHRIERESQVVLLLRT
jgi:hypothetical protein